MKYLLALLLLYGADASAQTDSVSVQTLPDTMYLDIAFQKVSRDSYVYMRVLREEKGVITGRDYDRKGIQVGQGTYDTPDKVVPLYALDADSFFVPLKEKLLQSDLAGTAGAVIVSFYVEADGKRNDLLLVKSTNMPLSDYIMAQIGAYKWKAIWNKAGDPVRTKYVIIASLPGMKFAAVSDVFNYWKD